MHSITIMESARTWPIKIVQVMATVLDQWPMHGWVPGRLRLWRIPPCTWTVGWGFPMMATKVVWGFANQSPAHRCLWSAYHCHLILPKIGMCWQISVFHVDRHGKVNRTFCNLQKWMCLKKYTHSKNIPQRVLGCWHNPTGQLMHVESLGSATGAEKKGLHTPSQWLAEFDARDSNTWALDC
jgi:hypothetical protein